MAVVKNAGTQFRTIAYNAIFKRNTTTLAFVLGGAIAGEALVHKVVDDAWEAANKGKLSHHILPGASE
eukprot:CAMPEP_0196736494 /NCGR_PEP_ID=MMETSP1091-20130531/14543_1 /TAXON_ID=302021 /ORGANISM="Rhodomonas sp., Strain CCMP768" /LENGTH=67 /DNA_ID=CAMNT_0042080241 /DNA_START=62 /DNA_END=265 /DNA_ORIENTATION=+